MGSKSTTSKSSGMNFGTSTQTPNPQAMAAYQGILNQAQNVGQIPYQMYQGQQVAGFSPDQLAAMQGIRESQGVALPYIDAATGAVNQAMSYADPSRFNAQEISRYFNPYQQNVIDATMANMREMNASQQNQLTGDAIQKGYLGGDRAGIARAELARQQAMTNNATLANLQNQGYQSAVDQFNKQQQAAIGAQQAGAYSLGALGTQAQNSIAQGLQALAASGAQQQALQQQQLTAAYEQWQRAMGYPYQQTQWQAGITGAIAPNMGGTTTSMGFGENSKTEPGPSVGGQIAGLLTSGLSLLPKFSDGGRVAKDAGGGLGDLSYLTRDNPFEDPQRQWQEGMRPWLSANADMPEDPNAVMRAAGGSLADPLAKKEESPFGGGGSWIPGIELHPAAPQFPAPAKTPELDTGGGGGGGDDTIGSLGKLGGALASKFGGNKDPIRLPGAAASTPEGTTVAAPAHTADDDRFSGIYADGGRVGFAEGGAPAGGASPGFGNLFAGWAARGAPTGVAGSSLMPAFTPPTQRQALPTPPAPPDTGGMNPMMMMGGGGKNSGMMMLLAAIQQQQAQAKYQADMAKYEQDKAAALAAPQSPVGYTPKSLNYNSIDPLTGLYSVRGWNPVYTPRYAEGGRVPRLRGGELDDEDLTINPVGRGTVPGDPRDYEDKPTGVVPLPPGARPKDFERPAMSDVDRGLAALRAIESSGRYGIVGPRSRTGDRPYGAYQVMGANIPAWGREAGFENLTPERFLADRKIQDAVARVQYQKYLEKEGGNPAYAAANWIGGPGWRKHAGAKDVLGTDAPEYMRRFQKAYASTGGGEGAPLAYTAADRPLHPGLGAIGEHIRNTDLSPIRVAQADGGAPQERTGLGSMWSPEVQQGLLAAGLGMLASRSPYAGVAIGEGGLKGIQAYQAAKSGAADAEYRRAQLEHLKTSDAREAEEWELKKRLQERSEKGWELLNEPGAGPSDAPVGPAAAPSNAPIEPPREAWAPAPEKVSAPGSPIDIRPGAQKPAEAPAAEQPAKPAAAPVGEFTVPREVQDKLREYNHWNAKASQAAATGNAAVTAELHRRAENAKFEYQQGLQQAKDDYARRWERQKYGEERGDKQAAEKRAIEEAELKKKQADPAYQADLEREKVAAKADADLLRDTNATGRAGRSAVATLKTLKEIAGGINFDAGPLAGPASTAKQALVQIGWADPNINSGNELFDSLANRSIKDQLGSLGNGVSNADVAFISKMSPARDKTAAGIQRILDFNIKLEQRKEDVARFTRKWAKDHNGRLGPDYEDALEQWANENPLFPEAAKGGAGKEGAGSKISTAAAAHLKANPNLREAFDQKYGQGAAASVLGE